MTRSHIPAFVALLMACTPCIAQPQSLEAALEEAAASGDVKQVRQALERICDRIAATATDKELKHIVTPDGNRRLMADLEKARDGYELLTILAPQIEAAVVLAHLLRSEPGDRIPAYRALASLIQHDESAVRDYTYLAAAIAAVYDQKGRYARRVNENTATSSSVNDVMRFFIDNSMILDPATTPPEVLVYIVDTSATVDELRWVRRTYGNPPTNLGQCYFEINYDVAHFRQGDKKAVTASGQYDLQSIKQHGGVCADQAHYASHVGKAFGVPTAYVRGRGVDVSHAWLGQLVINGRKTAWDFDEGRYDGYDNLRGEVKCPISGRWISDGEVALIAETAKSNMIDRVTTAALTDVVLRWAKQPPQGELEPFANVRARPKPRATDGRGQLALLREGLELTPHDAVAWRAMTDIAASQELTTSERNKWARAVLTLTGDQYADFAFEVLADLIEPVDDPARRAGLWNWTAQRFRKRPDLASAARFRQAELWREEGKMSKAWDACEDVATRYANESPDTVKAVLLMLDMLDERGKRDQHAIPTLERTWKRIQRPQQMAGPFATQSNWFRVGYMLAEEHASRGNASKAADVRNQLGLQP